MLRKLPMLAQLTLEENEAIYRCGRAGISYRNIYNEILLYRKRLTCQVPPSTSASAGVLSFDKLPCLLTSEPAPLADFSTGLVIF